MTFVDRLTCMLELSFVVALAGACDGDVFPDNATQFVPPTSYRLDWRIVESCSGYSGSYDELTWYTVPGSASLAKADAAGAYYPGLNRIVLSEGLTNDHELVRHEVLHALQPRADGHDSLFTIDCRGLVHCPEDCASEAGGWGTQPNAGSRTLPPESLTVSATVLPAQLADQGYVALIVSARNPRDEAVWADLQAIPRYEFRCLREGDPCGRVFNFLSEKAAFAPNEVRSAAFIVQLNPGPTLLAGAFNTNEAPALVVTPP